LRFELRLEFVEFLADSALQFGRSSFQPVVGSQRDHAGLSAEPVNAEFLESLCGICRLQIGSRLPEQSHEEWRNLLGLRHAEGCERILVRVFSHKERNRLQDRVRTPPAAHKAQAEYRRGTQTEIPCSARNGQAFVLRFFRRRLGRERFGFFSELREASGVLHRDVSQHFAVEFNAGGFEAVDQLTVSDAVQAGGSADTLNPQATILALLGAAIAKRITIGAICRFLRGLVQLALGEEKAFGPLEVLLAPCPAFCAAFYARHGFVSLCRSDSQEARNAWAVQIVLENKTGCGYAKNAAQKSAGEMRVAQRVCFRCCP
jgi:hypothetical protein